MDVVCSATAQPSSRGQSLSGVVIIWSGVSVSLLASLDRRRRMRPWLDRDDDVPTYIFA